MKNKKGFSLVELLIVIAIIAVLAVIIVPNVTNYLKKGKNEYNEKLNTELVTIAKSYYSENKSLLPRGYLNNQGLPINKTLVGAADLSNSNYITGEFKDSEGNDCTSTSYVIVEKEGNDYKYTSCIVCSNGYNNKESESKKDICVYTTPSGNNHEYVLPTCTLTLKEGTLNKWVKGKIVLNLEAEDNTLLLGYRLNNSTDRTLITKASKLNTSITIDKTLYADPYAVIVEDQYANEGICKLAGKIMLDNTKPQVTLYPNTNSYVNSHIYIKGNIKDDDSGIVAYAVTTTSNTPTNWITVNGNPKTLILPENDTFKVTSNNTYYVWAKDEAGNIGNSSITINKIDKTKPNLDSFVIKSNNSSINTKNTTITIKGSDAGSGIDKVCITTSNNANSCTWNDISSGTYTNNSYNVSSSDGSGNTDTLYAFVKDKVGNISSSKTVSYKLYKYCTQKEAYNYSSWSACSVSCGTGTQTRTIYYRDKNYTSYTSCGTTTESQSCNAGNCDTTGPTITVSNSSGGGWTFGPVYMTITATDPSGVSSIYYRYNSDSTSTIRNDWDSSTGVTNGIQVKGTWSAARDNYVYIVATDNLGNTSTSTTRVRIKSCGCGYRSSTYKNVPQWYHSADSSYHTTAYLHLCYCSDGSIYNCTSSGWSAAGGSGCYVHIGYNNYTALDYSWSNYSGSYW